MGSAQSARGIQLGGSGATARCGRIPSWDLSPALVGPRRAHFLRRRCAATGSGSAWKGSRRRWLAASAVSFTAPPARTSPLPGAVDTVLAAPSLPSGRDGAPRPRRDCFDRSGLSSVRPDRVASPGLGIGPRKRRQGSAAMSATHPTRLETRTKESNARASQRVNVKPRGAMKVRAGARRLRWDPGPSGAGRTTGPSRPHRRGGGA